MGRNGVTETRHGAINRWQVELTRRNINGSSLIDLAQRLIGRNGTEDKRQRPITAEGS